MTFITLVVIIVVFVFIMVTAQSYILAKVNKALGSMVDTYEALLEDCNSFSCKLRDEFPEQKIYVCNFTHDMKPSEVSPGMKKVFDKALAIIDSEKCSLSIDLYDDFANLSDAVVAYNEAVSDYNKSLDKVMYKLSCAYHKREFLEVDTL